MFKFGHKRFLMGKSETLDFSEKFVLRCSKLVDNDNLLSCLRYAGIHGLGHFYLGQRSFIY